jgi:hypothetical protein
MTGDAGAPVLIGTLEGDGDGADVFRQGERFFAETISLAIDDHDEEYVQRSRTDNYPSLEALLEAAGGGLRFVAYEGGSER